MNYFVIQVLTRSEQKFIRLANRALSLPPAGASKDPFAPEESATPRGSRYMDLPPGFSADALPGRILWPRRSLTIRRKGKNQHSLAPIFPGYLFYEADEIHPDIYWTLRRLSGFIRFLKSNTAIEPLGGSERALLLHFLSFGEIVDKSLVYFDENRRIRVVRGPLKGLEGEVVKVDKRKKRAKVRLAMYDERFLVDFGFDVLEPAEGHEKSKE